MVVHHRVHGTGQHTAADHVLQRGVRTDWGSATVVLVLKVDCLQMVLLVLGGSGGKVKTVQTVRVE